MFESEHTCKPGDAKLLPVYKPPTPSVPKPEVPFQTVEKPLVLVK